MIRQRRFTDTSYVRTVYFHCDNYVLVVDIVSCSNNARFLRVETNWLLAKQKQNCVICLDFISLPFLSAFVPCTLAL